MENNNQKPNNNINQYNNNYNHNEKQNDNGSKSQVISVGRSFGGFSVNLQ